MNEDVCRDYRDRLGLADAKAYEGLGLRDAKEMYDRAVVNAVNKDDAISALTDKLTENPWMLREVAAAYVENRTPHFGIAAYPSPVAPHSIKIIKALRSLSQKREVTQADADFFVAALIAGGF